MEPFKLILGNKNYSSWSMRPWLALKMTDIPFSEEKINLYTDDHANVMAPLLPAKTVPVLYHGNAIIGESLAILDYINDLFPEKNLWPEKQTLRATARMISSEMSCSYLDLRQNCPWDFRTGPKDTMLTTGTFKDIERIDYLWQYCFNHQDRPEGPFLLGSFSAADAMFAPIALRFYLHKIKVSEKSQAYIEHVRGLEPVQDWIKEAIEEKMIIDFSRGWPPFSYAREE